MRRISSIACDLIRACCEMNRNEHIKMEEFGRDKPDFQRIAKADRLTRQNNEIRHEKWNEINEGFLQMIMENKYDWEKLE